MTGQPPSPEPTQPAPGTAAGRPMKIVIVDDSRTQLQIVENTLQSFGNYKVVRAQDGEEALNQIDRNTDMILTDWSMPTMDGLQLVKKIRESYYLKNIPIIMITSKGDSKSVMEALSNGVDDFIVKPLRKDVLAKKINVYLLKNSVENGEEENNTSRGGKDMSKLPQKKPVIKMGEQPSKPDISGEKSEDRPPSRVLEMREKADKKREQNKAEDYKHQKHEKNPAHIQLAKETNIEKFGRLECEVCSEKLEDIEEGEGKYEVHFDAPQAEQISGKFSQDARLRVVCNNCHKIIHSQRPYLEVDELRKIMKQ